MFPQVVTMRVLRLTPPSIRRSPIRMRIEIDTGREKNALIFSRRRDQPVSTFGKRLHNNNIMHSGTLQPSHR